MSYRNDTNVPYDLSILSGIPDPTWAEKQVVRSRVFHLLILLPFWRLTI
jgi:hypothetical protein